MSLNLRIVGTIFGVVFATTGVAVASSLLPLLVVIGLVAGLCTYNAVQDDSGERARFAGHSPRRLGTMTAFGTVAVIYTVIGMVVLLGLALGLLVLAAALAWVAHRVLGSRLLRSGPDPSSAADDSDERPRQPEDRPRWTPLLPTDAAAASTADLCRAWRVSYSVLENTHDPAQLAEVAALRRRYLDELDRRDPDGFRRWFDDGARAASDPARYIRTRLDSPAQEDDAAA
jgi:hypothetical protein